MIFLNKDIVSVFNVNKDLIVNYKSEGDRYLVDIRRCLSKQLVYYILYTDLQKVNNSYFTIIDRLLNDEYEDVYKFKKDCSEFNNIQKVFLKSCEGFIDENVMEDVKHDIEKLDLLIQRLIYILENICYDESEDIHKNEVHSIF